MKKLLFVDDLRTLTVHYETVAFGIVTYARTYEAAMACADMWRTYDEIWLDHDLGLNEQGVEADVRDFAALIEEATVNGENLDRIHFRIVTANDVGRQWLVQALRFCTNVVVDYNT